MKHLLLLASSLVALVSCQASLGSGPFDGRVYEVALTGPDRKSQPDQLIFDGGRFESTLCRSHGFRGGAYSASADGFEAAPACAQSGKTEWNGTLHGDGIEGSMKWTDPQGRANEFHFNGKKANGMLDGQTFEGQVCEKGQKSGDKDRLAFANGGFDSNACRAWGFTITNYLATRDGDAIRFNADATNAGGETNHWEGTLRGETVTGTMKHMNAKGAVVYDYDFEAKRVR